MGSFTYIELFPVFDEIQTHTVVRKSTQSINDHILKGGVFS